MKRFILSAFSVLLATGAVATEATALPQTDPNFDLQKIRLDELDTRNKSEYSEESYYPSFDLHKIRLGELDTRNKSEYGEESYYPYGQSSAQSSEWKAPQPVADEQESIEATGNAEAVAPEVADASDEADELSLSVTQRRQEVLDRS